LKEVAALAAAVAGACGTMGVALRVCILPGEPPSTRWVRGARGKWRGGAFGV
jgi:hypothetical protein